MDGKALGNTKRYLRWTGARFKGVTTVKLPNGQGQEVIVFSEHGSLVAQTTVFNTIVVNERVFQSEKLRDYVMVHEAAHLGQWYGKPQFAVALTAIPFLLAAILTQSIIVGCGVGAALFLGYSWFMEFNADSEAIVTLGIQVVREARADKRAMFQPTLFWRISDRMTHPPIALTYRLVCILRRKQRS